MNENMKLRKELYNLIAEIDGDTDHGECFYEEEMLQSFLGKLERAKYLAYKYYLSNREEIENDD